MSDVTCETAVTNTPQMPDETPTATCERSRAKNGKKWQYRSADRRFVEKVAKAAAKECIDAKPSKVLASALASDPLLSKAVRTVQTAASKLMSCDAERWAATYDILDDAYALYNDNERNPRNLSDRLGYTGIPHRIDTPAPKLAVRIVLKASGYKPQAPSTEHEWATVVTALSLDAVPEVVGAAEKYLTDEVMIEGTKVRGFARAKARVKLEKKGSAQDNKAQRDAEAEDEFNSTVEARGNQPFGKIDPYEEVEVPDGYYLGLCRADSIVGVLKASEPAVRSTVVKLGLR